MPAIPRSSLILTAAGVLPFAWGAVTALSPGFGQALGLPPMFRGTVAMLTYGTVILSFMSGVLWGFAAKASGALSAVGHALSVIPALWAFFMTGGAPGAAAVNLAGGFVGVLMLDWAFWQWGLAPRWWMRLRVPVTVAVLACLAVPILLDR